MTTEERKAAPVPQEPTPSTFMAMLVQIERYAFTLPATRFAYWDSSTKLDTLIPQLRIEATLAGDGVGTGYFEALSLIRLLYDHGLTDVSALTLALTMAGYSNVDSAEATPFEKGWTDFDTIRVRTEAVPDIATGAVLRVINTEFRILNITGWPEQRALVLMVQLLQTLIAHRVVSPRTLHTVLLATGHRPVDQSAARIKTTGDTKTDESQPQASSSSLSGGPDHGG